MNLEERMDTKSEMTLLDGKPTGIKYILVEVAIEIAKQYAEEKRKELADAISEELKEQNYTGSFYDVIIDTTLKATEGYIPKSWREISGYVAMNDSKSIDISNMSFDGSLSRINRHWGNSQQIKRCKILISK